MIVLDSNVISELMRNSPADPVVRWVEAQAPPDVCTTSVSVAEIMYGIARLPGGRRQAQLRAAAVDVFTAFADQILAFDAEAARHYADLVVERERAGAPISGFDAQIAAICCRHSAALATRNTHDFEHVGLDLRNPWSASNPVG